MFIRFINLKLKFYLKKFFIFFIILIFIKVNIKSQFSRPWVFWYWIDAAVSKEGITADLEAMSKIGIEGAYLMFIKGEKNPTLYQPSAIQFSDYWWQCLKHAFSEAQRLKIKLALHISDGFALAGGPWITPELSMQKLVFSELFLKGNVLFHDTLPQPECNENYYKDIAIYAIPVDSTFIASSFNIKPIVTTSSGEDASFIAVKGNKKVFKSNNPCWIQFYFEKPFTCRSITIYNNNTNYQSLRMLIQVSDDGIVFKDYFNMIPPRHGWQDEGIPSTFAIPEITSKYYRFVFNPEGSEPGSEDLDFAKWRHTLRITGIELMGMPRINQYEGKSGRVWRIGEMTEKIIKENMLCIPESQIINITDKFKNNILNWYIPEGYWLILRIGHTSTGKRNTTGGGAKGLECDKFNPYAIKLQLDSWFGTIYDTLQRNNIISPLKIMHVDSWECGSQNWSENFNIEFMKRRGYDLMKFLPVAAGIPINSFNFSENVLFDLRKTISDLISDIFFKEVSNYAHQYNCLLSAESVAPVMICDNISYFKFVDIPMGEFWLDSPTHDKPSDISDAINAAIVFNKKTVVAESFTQLRISWKEHPALLKPLADFYLSKGINGFVFHVFAHNPWLNQKPGMTLDRIGLYFQRDQTWFDNGGKAFLNYLSNCIKILQNGNIVSDFAIFSGNEIPSRSVLPYQLYEVIPNIFSNSVKKFENERVKNTLKIIEKPNDVYHTAAIPVFTNYIDPIDGFNYFSVNAEGIMSAYVKDNKVIIGNTECSLIIFPGYRKMDPRGNFYDDKLLEKIFSLVYDGATVFFVQKPANLNEKYDSLFSKNIIKYGNGIIIYKSFDNDFLKIKFNIEKDFFALNKINNCLFDSLSWIHKKNNDIDIYFVSNQSIAKKKLICYFKNNKKYVVVYDPLNDFYYNPKRQIKNKYSCIDIDFSNYQSYFVIFSNNKIIVDKKNLKKKNKIKSELLLNLNWDVTFYDNIENQQYYIKMDSLISWTDINNDDIKYFSGTAKYSAKFFIKKFSKNTKIILDLGRIYNVAELYINGKYVSTLWTLPYETDITDYIIESENLIDIYITNTWHNKFFKEINLNNNKKIKTITNFYINESLEKSGLFGPLKLKYLK